MKRATAVSLVLLTALGSALVAGCSSTSSSSAAASSASVAAAPMTKADFCAATAPFWNFQAIPNADDPDLTSQARDEAIASLTAAAAAMPQGVALGIVSQAEAETTAQTLPILIAVFKNPELMKSDTIPPAETFGLSQEEYDAITSDTADKLTQSAYSAMMSACG